MTIVRPDRKRDVFTWNGMVEDQEKARAAFEQAMETGGFLAYAVDTKTKDAELVKDFTTESDIILTPQLAGG